MIEGGQRSEGDLQIPIHVLTWGILIKPNTFSLEALHKTYCSTPYASHIVNK